MPIMKKRIMLKLHYGSTMCTIIIVFEDISVYLFIKNALFIPTPLSISPVNYFYFSLFVCGAVINLNLCYLI